jgi:Pirin C-terminal cupin domain
MIERRVVESQLDLQARRVARVIQPEATSDGAGVKLKRSIALRAGEGVFGITKDDGGEQVSAPRLVVFDDGDEVRISALGNGLRLLLISGKPLNEPIARYGPFVMNTEEEIEQALLDLRRGTFVK